MTPTPTQFHSFAFLHGFLGNRHFWNTTEEKLQSEFPAAEMLSFNLPGHDDSSFFNSSNNESIGFDHAVQWFTTQVQSHAPCWAIGYSMGARLALGALLHRPELFRGAVLISLHPGIIDETERQKRQQWERSLMAMLQGDTMIPLVDQFESLPVFTSQQYLPEETKERQRTMRLSHRPRHVARAIPVLGLGHTPDMNDALARNTIPIHLITGGLDAKYTAMGASLSRIHPNIEHTIIPNAGHNPLLESPGSTIERIHGCVRNSM